MVVLFDDHGVKWTVTLGGGGAESTPVIAFGNAEGDEILAPYHGDRADERDLDLQEVVPYFLQAG